MQMMKEKIEGAFEAMKASRGYTNKMQAPRVTKVVISTGVGKIPDKAKRKMIEDRIARITGQKVAARGAKKSVASFKIRQGDVIGYQATLRGARMNSFLDKLINIALPRTRDFRGIPLKALDEMGNISIGLKENTIFPECSDEDIKDVFGFAITIVTTAKTKEEADAFLRYIGFPLQAKDTAITE
jgi:large subunit ribosomal protein L5